MPLSDTQLSLEKARVRDLLRYYIPKKAIPQNHGSLLEIDAAGDVLIAAVPAAAEVLAAGEQNCDAIKICDDPFPSIVSRDVAAVEAAEENIPNDSELLSHDPTLMAFTQLGAFRLNCQRSFISLMDGENQYIIAEATRSVSINNPEDYDTSDPGEKVYLGARKLDMQWGICPNTIQVFTALDDNLNVSTDIVTANKECYVMNDLSAIPAFLDRPYVSGWPYMRFYAEVPIHSPTGFVIGTYCVVDDKPRDGLDRDGLKAMNEISSAIMNHLTLVRSQRGLQLAEEMVKGLGRFVEGKSSLQGPQSGNLCGSLRPAYYHTGTAQTLSTETDHKKLGREPISAPSSESLSEKKSVAVNSVPSSQGGCSSSDGAAFRSRERKLSLDDISEGRESLASSGTRILFSRACDLIRDAIDVDGIIFIDACFRDNTSDPGRVSRIVSPDLVQSQVFPDTPEYEHSEWMERKTVAASEIAPSVTSTSNARSSIEHHRRSGLSDVLGYSTQDRAGLGGITSSSRQVALPQSTLRGLLRCYRQGHIFVFNDDGTLAQNAEELRRQAMQKQIFTDDGTQSAMKFKHAEEQAWAKQIIKICVGARAVIVFPLWDPQRDQWFAGGLAWTTDPTRILQREDVTYLTAFGSCVMAEKSRLDAVNADRAKADFISSVSHELRSPLHGVLASAEALQETSTGFAQDDMIRTITVCGEVLLDTMDQILDYAKMSNSANSALSKKGKNVPKNPDSQVVKNTSLDLSNLVETIAEGILAGHTYRKGALVSTTGQKDSTNLEPGTFATPSEDIMVIVSIDWQASWIFESQIGGWKRILMNLFGNALKYTEAGFVHICLRASRIPTLLKSASHTVVTLQIDDSGKGMSKDYMKYDLFTPFAQEDHMSVGTGLGLSIVKQLVADLGGTIDIQSERGYGTSVKVTATLKTSESPQPQLLENGSMIQDIKTRCKGLTLCLTGFEYYPDIGDTPTGLLTAHSQRMLALKASIATFAVDWFGMNLSTASSLHSANGDILIGLQSKLDFSGESWKSRPLIVFEDVAPTRHLDDRGIFWLSQPVGPHKMARILGQCLKYTTSLQRLKSAEEIPIMPQPSSDTPSSDLVALVEGINEKAVHALRILNTTNQITKQELLTKRSTSNSSSKFQASTIKGITQQMTRTTIVSNPEIPSRSRVLLVEDNIINMKILVNYMKNTKHEFATAVNGLEGLQQYQAAPQSFKVVFMDISMPVMDGLASTRQIRLHERENSLPRTRIVALTCFSSAEYQRDALHSGIDLFLIKPVPMKTLRPILELDPDVVIPNPI